MQLVHGVRRRMRQRLPTSVCIHARCSVLVHARASSVRPHNQALEMIHRQRHPHRQTVAGHQAIAAHQATAGDGYREAVAVAVAVAVATIHHLLLHRLLHLPHTLSW